MNIYALLVALVLVTALLMQGYRQGNKKYVIVACLLLFAVYGLRNAMRIGDDNIAYLHRFQRAATRSWEDIFDGDLTNVGFTVLLKVLFELTNGDYQLFISLVAVFVTICFGRLVYQYSPNPLASILYHFGLLLFTFHFSVLKQSIAMAILMLAFDQVVKRKLFPFLFLVFVAAQFHFPALVFLPAYWMPILNPGRGFVVFLSALLLITYFFREQILGFMLSLYKDEDIGAVDLGGIQFIRTKALIMIVIVVVSILLRKPKPEDPVYSVLLEFIGIAVVFQTFCGYNNIFERLADYYFQFSIIFIPMVFDKYADREPLFGWRFMSVIDTLGPYLFCGFGAYRFISFCTNDSRFFPFRFFFQA